MLRADRGGDENTVGSQVDTVLRTVAPVGSGGASLSPALTQL